MRNEQVLQRVKDETDILCTTKRREANRINHILCMNCLPKHVTSGNMEVTRGTGGICRQLLNILKLKCRDEFERGITGSLNLENSLWNRQQNCVKTDQTTNDVSHDAQNMSDEDVLPTLQIFYTLHNDSLLLSGTS